MKVTPAFSGAGARLVETLLDTFLDAAHERGSHVDAITARRALADVRKAIRAVPKPFAKLTCGVEGCQKAPNHAGAHRFSHPGGPAVVQSLSSRVSGGYNRR